MTEKPTSSHAVFQIQNKGSASGTYMDLIDGGNSAPPGQSSGTRNFVGGYQKVEGQDFRNQYWHIVPANDDNRTNAYFIVNIRTNKYLSLKDAASKTSFAITVNDRATSTDKMKLQEWYFEKKDGFWKIQNAAGRAYDEKYGYLYLKENNANDYVEILTGKSSDETTQRWNLISRSRTADEIITAAKKTTLLHNAGSLLPGPIYLQMPGTMFKTIYEEYFGNDANKLIKDEEHARFDRQQIFAFKSAVNRWANGDGDTGNLKCSGFFILCGLAFGIDKAGAVRTTSWCLDETLTNAVFFKSVNRELVTEEPQFTPTFAFF